MSVSLTNNANGGTNAATVAYGNSGATSGEGWDIIFIGTGASIIYSNTQARGSLSYQFATTATATQSYVQWQAMNSPTLYVRFYLYLPALPSVAIRVCEVNDGTTKLMSIGVRADGTISIRDSAEAAMSSSVLSVPIGRWARIEAKIVSHATAGSSVVRLYREADSPYPAEKMTSAATFNTKPAANFIVGARFGITGFNVANIMHYIDDIAVSDVDYLGPGDPTFAPSLLRSNNAEMGSNGTAISLANTGDSTNNFFQQIDASTSITFSNAQSAHGSLSYLFQSASGTENRVFWTELATSAAAGRFYAYFTVLPPSGTEIFQFTTNGNGTFEQLGRFTIRSDGKIQVYDRGVSSLWTSSAAISLNTWYRFELFAQLGGTPTTGTINFAYYSLDSGTAIDTFSTSAADLGAENIEWMRLGKLSANTWTDPFYIDEIAVQQQASGYIGAYSGSPSAPATYTGIIPHLGWGRAA